MELLQFKIKGELITIFHDKQEWINKAQSRCSGFEPYQKLVYIDANGHSCNFGKHFSDAKYPVTVYRLITTSENIENQLKN